MELIYVCSNCGQNHRLAPTAPFCKPPTSKPQADQVAQIDRCPPPQKFPTDWQAAFVQADDARSKAECELEREREISDRFQKENNRLTMKCAALDETLGKSIEDAAQLQAERDQLRRDLFANNDRREQLRLNFHRMQDERNELRALVTTLRAANEAAVSQEQISRAEANRLRAQLDQLRNP